MLNYKIGLTDLVKLTSGNDTLLRKRDYDVASFTKKIFLFQPMIVCFNGKKAAAEFWGKKTKEINYGPMAGTIGETRLFCAPSTSGSARGFWDESIWAELKSVLQSIENTKNI